MLPLMAQAQVTNADSVLCRNRRFSGKDYVQRTGITLKAKETYFLNGQYLMTRIGYSRLNRVARTQEFRTDGHVINCIINEAARYTYDSRFPD